MQYKVFLYGVTPDPMFMKWESDFVELNLVADEVWHWLNSNVKREFSDAEGFYLIRTSMVSKVLIRKR